MQKLAIIGAGLSGLLLANALKDKFDITVFEKARGVGGRMSSRYADPYFFDHGCQYFTAETAGFKTFLQPFLSDETVQEWLGNIVTLNEGNVISSNTPPQPHYVAAPNMNSLCKKLSDNIDVILSTEIAPLSEKQPDGWHLTAKTGEQLGVFDWVISTAPPKQAAVLFGIYLPGNTQMNIAQHHGCYTLMLGFNSVWKHKWKAAKIENSPFEWVAINSTKPARNHHLTCIVANTLADWAEVHIDEDMKAMEAVLLPEFVKATGINQTPDFISLHRWRYATTTSALEIAPIFNQHHKLAAVSDWCSNSTIEQVWHNVQKLVTQF